MLRPSIRSRSRRHARAVATIAALGLMAGLTACTPESRVAEGSSVRVALDAPFTSFNPNTGHGSSNDTNASIVAATNSSFASWNEQGELVADESFGSVEKLSDDPLTVRYTVADGVEWSDGVEVDAADLLLSWAANSHALNDREFDPSEHLDPETGLFDDSFPEDVVYFDGFTANVLHLAGSLPETDDRSITLRFDEHVPDWAAVFDVGLPAHVVAQRALGDDLDAAEAKRAVTDAITTGDRDALVDLSRAWNVDFVVEDREVDPGILVGTGPYRIARVAEGSVTLTANPRYNGEHRPRFETVELLVIADPLEAVAAFGRGEVDVIAPQPSGDVMAALDDLGAEPVASQSGVWELLQVRFADSANGTLEDAALREAFLTSVPQKKLVEAAGAPGAPAVTRRSFTTMPGAEGYDDALDASADVRIAHDASAAKRLVASSAATQGAATVCVLFDPANPRRVAQFTQIRDAAASAGFTVTDCSSPDWRNLLGTPRAWDVALYGLRERTLSTQAATSMFGSDSPLNHGRFASDDVDAVLAAMERQDDAGERAALRAELDALLWREGWGMPLVQLPAVTVVAPEVAGVEPSPFAASVLHDVWNWRPAPAASAGELR